MCVLCLQRLGKEVDWPESTVPIRALGRPCSLWVAVETVDQDDIYLGTWVGVNSCDVESGDLPVDCPLNGVKSEIEPPKQLIIMQSERMRAVSSADVEWPATWKALLTSKTIAA